MATKKTKTISYPEASQYRLPSGRHKGTTLGILASTRVGAAEIQVMLSKLVRTGEDPKTLAHIQRYLQGDDGVQKS